MTYSVPQLEYQYDQLRPSVSAEVMELHHRKHHQTYVDKLNTAIDRAPELAEGSLESLLKNLATVPEPVRQAVRNNGGGHYNHSLFWQWLSPEGGGEPTGDVAAAIERRYGSFQQFVDEFTTQALGVFGSGWVWLQPNMDILTTPNQDNPLMLGLEEPLLGLDVWEHAYYLDYKNKRDDYIASWWDVVNWHTVAERSKLAQ